MSDQIEIAVRFTIPADEELKLPHYTDTLFIPADEYDATDIEALKVERYNNWKNAVLNPLAPEVVEAPNNQQLLDTVAGLREQIDALQTQISSME